MLILIIQRLSGWYPLVYNDKEKYAYLLELGTVGISEAKWGLHRHYTWELIPHYWRVLSHKYLKGAPYIPMYIYIYVYISDDLCKLNRLIRLDWWGLKLTQSWCQSDWKQVKLSEVLWWSWLCLVEVSLVFWSTVKLPIYSSLFYCNMWSC